MSELERLNEQWNTAWLKKDVAFVERRMAPEYVYVAPTGQVLDRNAILNVIKSPTYKLQRSTRTIERTIELSSNVVAMILRSRAAGMFQGRGFTDDNRCVSVFVKRGRDWLIAFEQCSPIA